MKKEAKAPKAAKAAKLGKAAKLAKTAKPAKLASAAKPAKVARAAKTAKMARAAKPAKVARATKAAKVAEVAQPTDGVQRGVASWYGPGFHGRRTASGETFNTNAMTAAHRSLPFGTQVRVENHSTGRSVVVRINDRGPFAHGRIIDLSRASAEALGISGVASVEVSAL